MLKLTTDKHEASRGLSATAELLVIFGITQSKISRFKQFLLSGILRKLATTINCPLHLKSVTALPCEIQDYYCYHCYRKLIIKCFNEEVKTSNKNCKVNGSAVCFLYNIFFLCYFYSRSLYCFNQSSYCFLRDKVGGSEKNRLLNGVVKWFRRQRHRRCSK